MTSAREETSRLADLLRTEHHALAEFLVALAAFDRARRWAELGYSSLFAFLRRELRLSAGAAQYRKTAAELVRRYPEVERALRTGDLCLSSVVELGKVVTPENVRDLLPRFFGLSSREAAAVAASIRPVASPPLQDVVTVVRTALAPAATPSARTETSGSLPAAGAGPLTLESVRAPEMEMAAPPDAPPRSLSLARFPRRDLDIEPLDGELRRLHVTVSRRLLEKLDAARDALSHSHPCARAGEILEVALDLVLERHAKRRGLVKKPRKPAPVPTASPAVSVPSSTPSPSFTPSPTAIPAARRSRYIPAEVRRAVWKRDGGCCQWPVDAGGICGSTFRVELDHIDGWAKGAGATVDELRVLCRVHQDVSARQLYGDAVMDNYTGGKGGRCAEPAAVYGASTDRGNSAHRWSAPFRSAHQGFRGIDSSTSNFVSCVARMIAAPARGSCASVSKGASPK